MRLAHENNILINNVVDQYDWLACYFFHHIQNSNYDYSSLLQLVHELPLCFLASYNIFLSNSIAYPVVIDTLLHDPASFAILESYSQFSNWLTLFYVFTPDQLTFTNTVTWFSISFLWDISTNSVLLFFYFVVLLWKISLESIHYTKAHTTSYTHTVNIYLYTWVLGGIDKTDSTEEIISLLILWPWCILLVFTHLFAAGNHNFIFGFAEWGLPILYGLILLAEHVWTFGTYFLVYLTGTRARKSITISLIEDLIALTILLARVLLQAVRGVIVGMFHFICREALLNLTGWWNISFYVNTNPKLETESLSFTLDFINLTSDIAIAAGSFVIVTAIMFLQLTFLVVSVWLFCKCWFISWHPNINTQLGVMPSFKPANETPTTSHSIN